MWNILSLPWWYYLVGIFGALLVGVFICAIGFMIWSKYESWKLKRGTPFETPLVNINLPFGLKNKKVIDRKQVSEFLKNPEIKEKYSFKGLPVESNEKEVIEDDKRKSDKFREFEKLRRESLTTRKSNLKRDSSIPKRSSIQERDVKESRQNNTSNSGDVELE